MMQKNQNNQLPNAMTKIISIENESKATAPMIIKETKKNEQPQYFPVERINNENLNTTSYFVSLRSIYVPSAYESMAIRVEVSMRRGLPSIRLSGFQQNYSQDTIERIKNALYATKIKLPCMSFVINLSPVDTKKFGSYLDLSMFVTFLKVIQKNQYSESPILLNPPKQIREQVLYLGELSLSGEIRPIPQILQILCEAKKLNFKYIILPQENLKLAYLIPDLHYYPIINVAQLYDTWSEVDTDSTHHKINIQINHPISKIKNLKYDFMTLQALTLAAAGWHSSLLIGPPGCGKSSFAREVTAFLPPLCHSEIIDIFMEHPYLYSEEQDKLIVERPIRSPHHSSTRRAMVGGGNPIRAGEVTLAHHGVLILDELSEFSRESLNALREPLEQREIRLSKGKEHAVLPSRFLLCASANPCPCGDLRNRPNCRCSDMVLQKYRRKFSGALQNRIDIILELPTNTQMNPCCDEQVLRKRVDNALKMQATRFKKTPYRYNSDLPLELLDSKIPLTDSKALVVWNKIQSYKKFSFRITASIRKMARTLADMECREHIIADDLIQASNFKSISND